MAFGLAGHAAVTRDHPQIQPFLLRRVQRVEGGGSAVIMAGVAVLIVFFPVSTFWAILFGFWLPVLIAMQIFFPALRQLYDIEVEAAELPPEPDAALTEKQKKAARRANWWHYHWGLVVAGVVLAASVVYVIHGLNTTVDPDYAVAVVTADTLPDASAQKPHVSLRLRSRRRAVEEARSFVAAYGAE